MSEESRKELIERLGEVHDLVIGHIKGSLESEDPTTRALAVRDALQLLRQNGISAASMPENPVGRIGLLIGKIDTGSLDQKLGARRVLPIAPAGGQPLGALSSTRKPEGKTVDVASADLDKPAPQVL